MTTHDGPRTDYCFVRKKNREMKNKHKRVCVCGCVWSNRPFRSCQKNVGGEKRTQENPWNIKKQADIAAPTEKQNNSNVLISIYR